MSKPVAWMDKRTNKCVVFINTPPSNDWIPLYTHSAKELTDKEILEEWDWDSGEILATDLLDFADAIIKKVKGDV